MRSQKQQQQDCNNTDDPSQQPQSSELLDAINGHHDGAALSDAKLTTAVLADKLQNDKGNTAALNNGQTVGSGVNGEARTFAVPMAPAPKRRGPKPKAAAAGSAPVNGNVKPDEQQDAKTAGFFSSSDITTSVSQLVRTTFTKHFTIIYPLPMVSFFSLSLCAFFLQISNAVVVYIICDRTVLINYVVVVYHGSQC